jgi:hypothetical protein
MPSCCVASVEPELARLVAAIRLSSRYLGGSGPKAVFCDGSVGPLDAVAFDRIAESEGTKTFAFPSSYPTLPSLGAEAGGFGHRVSSSGRSNQTAATSCHGRLAQTLHIQNGICRPDRRASVA